MELIEGKRMLYEESFIMTQLLTTLTLVRKKYYTAVKIMVFCEMLVVALFDLDMEL